MRTYSAPLLAAMAARYGKACHVLKIEPGDSGAPDTLYWTDAPFTIPYDDGDGLVSYVQQWFICGDVVTDDQGNQAVDLTFPDINKIVRSLLYSEDWSRRPATLTEVWFDPVMNVRLDPAAAIVGSRIKAKGRADGGRPNFEDAQEPVTISIVPDSDALGLPGPAQTYESSCRYLSTSGYQGIQCAAVSAFTTCNGSPTDCAARNNLSRYGGFPYAPKPGSTIITTIIGTR